MRTPTTHTLLALLALMATGCDGKDSSEAEIPTYTRDVAPIIDSRCAGCHVEGGIAPFPLTSYEEVSLYADWVADAVVDRRMPPGQAAEGCNEYVADPSLSDEEIATIADWAEGGAQQGEASDAVETEVARDPNELDRVDLRLTMPEPYTPDPLEDDYRCFILDWPETEDMYVTGFGTEPGTPEIVHHVIVYLAGPDVVDSAVALDEAEEGPGYTCFGGPGGERGQRASWLGAWVPGQLGRNMAEGTGIRVEAGSKLIMQVHYHPSEDGVTADQSTILLRVDETVTTPSAMFPFADPTWPLSQDMPIPANTEGVIHSYSMTWPSDTWIYDSGVHMHTRGRSASHTITHTDGSETCLADVEDWDFNWQMSYRLAEPVRLEAGATLNLTCVFDNTGDEELNWGEDTDQEMCLGITFMADPD